MKGWLLFLILLAGVTAPARAFNLNQNFKLRIDTETVRFNPTREADLRHLEDRIEQVAKIADGQSKHEWRGLVEIDRLAKAALDCTDPEKRAAIETDLVETVYAVNNIARPPIPPHFDVVMGPLAVEQLYRPVGVGHTPAKNLQPGPSDLSLRDPLPTSFWSKPKDIRSEDLSVGFGRAALPDMAGKIWHYKAAKETAGMNPGYEIESGDIRVKLKFGEQSSEPVVTRIFWAMGFHADPTDYSAGVKVAYDRRIFTEFNSRLPLRTKFTVFWIVPVYKMNLQRNQDPFNFVAKAVLRDGKEWTAGELKAHLWDGTNFDAAVEKQIDYLVTTPANVQVKDPQIKSIGPWDYGQLDHADRRELRGAGLLAAWLGFYDARFDNTKLRLVGPRKNARVEHYFSDLGGGLGQTTGPLSWHGENVHAFPWTFTASTVNQGRGMHKTLDIVGYTPVVRNDAFAAMTLDDARWMARLIGQLRAEQIEAALKISGYDGATCALYTKKLLHRRNQMMADLGLAREFPALKLGPE